MPARTDLELRKTIAVGSYRDFLGALLDAGLASRTHIAEMRAPSTDRVLLLRHDVDHDLEAALAMAQIEHELGVVATYFLLPPGDYGATENYYGRLEEGQVLVSTRLQEISVEIARLGHEIGLHNDFLQLSRITGRPIDTLIFEQMTLFAELGIPILGTASHGSRFARGLAIVNSSIFREVQARPGEPSTVRFPDGATFPLHSVSYRTLGLEYEAYDVRRDLTISDTGGRLIVLHRGGGRPEPLPPGPLDLAWLRGELATVGAALVLLHPDWWKPVGDPTMSSASRPPLPPRPRGGASGRLPHLFERCDGKPFRVLIRGDSCARRCILLNRDLAPNGLALTQNERSPLACFVDTLNGRTPDRVELEAVADVAAMPPTLAHYYLAQIDRSILTAEGADLLVIDTFADAALDLWEHRRRGSKLWTNTRYLRSKSTFEEDYRACGRCQLPAAAGNARTLIAAVRLRNPGLPVLFLTQPLDLHARFVDRRELDDLGGTLAASVADLFWGGRLRVEELEPEHNAGGPTAPTLNFSAATYRRMLEHAIASGLAEALLRRRTAPTPPARGPIPAGGRASTSTDGNAGSRSSSTTLHKAPTTPRGPAELPAAGAPAHAPEVTRLPTMANTIDAIKPQNRFWYFADFLAVLDRPCTTLRQLLNITGPVSTIGHECGSEPEAALALAEIERRLGLATTFFLPHPSPGAADAGIGEIRDGRVVLAPRQIEFARQLLELGHEICLLGQIGAVAERLGRGIGSVLDEIMSAYRRHGVQIVGMASPAPSGSTDPGAGDVELFDEWHGQPRPWWHPPTALRLATSAGEAALADVPRLRASDYGLLYHADCLPCDARVVDYPTGMRIDRRDGVHVSRMLVDPDTLQRAAFALAVDGSCVHVHAIIRPELWLACVAPAPRVDRELAVQARISARLAGELAASMPNVLRARQSDGFVSYDTSYSRKREHFGRPDAIVRYVVALLGECRDRRSVAVLELGCGQGELLEGVRRQLKQAHPTLDVRCTGIDGSAVAIRQCAARFPEVTWIADRIETALGDDAAPLAERRFDIVIDKAGTSFVKDESDAARVLRAIYGCLDVGGRYVFTYAKGFYRQLCTTRAHWRSDWIALATTVFDHAERSDDLPGDETRGYIKIAFVRDPERRARI